MAIQSTKTTQSQYRQAAPQSNTLLWAVLIIWPVVVAGVSLFGLTYYVAVHGLPGRFLMPLTTIAAGKPAVLGATPAGAGAEFQAGVTVTASNPPQVGIGPFTATNPPQRDVDILAESLRVNSRDGDDSLRVELPQKVHLVIDGPRPLDIDVGDFIRDMQKRATVENLISRVQEVQNAATSAKQDAAVAQQLAHEAATGASQAQALAESAQSRADKAAAVGGQGVSLAREAQQMAKVGQEKAAQAQATGDRATDIANTAQQTAGKATATSERAVQNTLALKRYVDYRDAEIQSNINEHYRSNRPGGKELVFRKINVSGSNGSGK